MKKTMLWLIAMTLAGSAAAIDMSGFKGAPIAQLTADEKKAFHAALVQVLNQVPDRTTTEWKASGTKLTSRITPVKRSDEGQLLCRETVIESVTPDRQHHGSYVFCRNAKGEWNFRRPDSKAASKKKK